MADMDLKFADCRDLARLKYYDVDETGKLVANPDEVPRVVDFHTHLGMVFAFAPRLNLMRKTDKVKYFCPYEGMPIDLDVYSGGNFTEEGKKQVAPEFIKTIYSNKGYVSTQTVPNIIADMDRMRISHGVVLALDFPWGLSDCSNLYLKSTAHEPRLICYACVHPYSFDRAEMVERFLNMGAAGIKLHPAQLFYRANNPRLRDIFEVCRKRRVPVLFHSGASPLSPKFLADLPAIKYFKEPVRDFPELIFIFGHSGIEEYREVIELGKKHDNVYMEVSGQPPRRILEMVDGIGDERVLFGSDWPFYPFEYPLAKSLIATEGKLGLREKILYKNAERLLKEYGNIQV